MSGELVYGIFVTYRYIGLPMSSTSMTSEFWVAAVDDLGRLYDICPITKDAPYMIKRVHVQA